MRVSFDIGGTFTDLVLLDETSGRAWLGKCLTTYDDFSRAIEQGIHQVLDAGRAVPSDIDRPVTGATTLVTNALIERRGADTALITTQGFGDTLDIGREWRYDLYDQRLRLPEPLVPVGNRFEVTERLFADGSVHVPLDPDEVARIAHRLGELGVESVAVCLLHSYASPVHEEAVAKVLAEHLPGVPVTLSGHLVPVIREYERTVTTLANAYVRPVAGEHFQDIERAVGRVGIDQPLVLMQSNGGVIATPTAREYPLRLLESGPAAGAIGAAHVGRRLGLDRLIAFDMGGTTAKICIIENGEPTVHNGFEVGRVHRLKPGSGLPVTMPVVDMLEIGAGGGSIAALDALGLLKVGPHSAGSRPGPAGYGLGGDLPTVTDADIVLGYLDPDYFLGGRMPLDVEAARRAVVTHLGAAFGDDPVAAAAGVVRVVDEHMALAMQVHATERGHDPRTFTMLAFGGAAPVHAARVARTLGLRRVVIPSAAGVLSATGLLVAPPMVEASRTRRTELANWSAELAAQTYDALVTQAVSELAEPVDRVEYFVDMRYVGQGFEIEVRVEAGDGPQRYLERFAAEYERIYAVRHDYPRAEVVTWRVRVYGRFTRPEVIRTVPPADGAAAAPKTREVWFPETGPTVAPVLRMLAQPPGVTIDGPAILQLPESTAVIGPGDRAEVDEDGNLHVLIDLPSSGSSGTVA
ncbi:hydantoinase/oxoprolinase family protein [Dactylosporangium sp. AC04546]|uniref:hydantoinase/oxoprolinase family protein n=1 Tax=Dactylosporangium sp. AC04546 TaxID=2862460 RepID=UPI001EDF6ACF|nr:hydantoinase/oxoprolinase family protein [Dactylosporangium sp. AC04546]WVK78589.1 hydantoinase/oxoprolinase family protein [Dactylosporangium sp. AC04546]